MHHIALKKILVSFAFCTMIFACLLYAQAHDFSVQEGRLVPKLLNYQGYLTDTIGIPVDDTLDMTFKIFDALSSGNELWSETQTNVPIERGVFSVLLGETTPIPDSVFADFTSTWLELTLEGPQTLTPRTRITSVGYAYMATYSDTAEYARVGIDNDWTLSSNILYPSGAYGLSMRSGNVLYGDSARTHVNFGVACTTGTSGQNYKYCTVGGGRRNIAGHDYATVSGGYQNKTTGTYAAIGGGSGNTAYTYTTIGGGYFHTASNFYATVGGGYWNTVSGLSATIAGGEQNNASTNYSTIGGGMNNTISGDYATLAGGLNCRCTSDYTFVGGGENNQAQGTHATIGGGHLNTISGSVNATIGGGNVNSADGNYAAVLGGYANSASAQYSTVCAGGGNSVGGDYSAILGGYSNQISGAYSYLFGIDAALISDSTFMVDMPHIRFGDETNGYEFPTTDGSNGQYLITDGSGQLSWSSAADTDWVFSGSDMYSGISGNVGVGVIGPAEKLDVDGAVNVSSVYKIGGYTMISYAGLNNTFVGVGAGENNTTGSYNNTFFGDSAGFSNASGKNNTLLGHNAGHFNTADNSTFLGTAAGYSNTTGDNNTFSGFYAGLSNTTGNNNTFSGFCAGRSNTTGYGNTFTGTEAGYSDTTGYYNTFTGYRVGYFNTTGRHNTFSGNQAGYNNTTGLCNVITGGEAGFNNTTGICNTFIGYGAGYYNIDGDSSVFIGHHAGFHETGSNKLYIANGKDSANVLIYGEFDNQRVGIATLDPGSEFSVNGGASIGNSYAGTAAPANGMIVEGNVGVGTTTPARKLHVSDVMRLEPRTDPPSSAAMGDMYVDSDDGKLYVYDGSVWQGCW